MPLQGVSLFLPQIVERLGYSTVQTNLAYGSTEHHWRRYVAGLLAFASDYTRWRFPFIALGFFFTFCGFIIYASIDVESQSAGRVLRLFYDDLGNERAVGAIGCVVQQCQYGISSACIKPRRLTLRLQNIADENRRLFLDLASACQSPT